MAQKYGRSSKPGRSRLRASGEHARIEFGAMVIYEDDDLVAVDKPAGVASQGGAKLAGINLVDLARRHYGHDRIGVLHRLDRNVSGLVLLAKTAPAARAMSAAFARGDVERVYVAVVRGAPQWEERSIDALLAKDERTRVVRAIDPADIVRAPGDAGVFRASRTDVRVLERFRSLAGELALIEARPRTGRSHQIRVHLAHVGLPIVGDPKYGVTLRGARRPLLHACRLQFEHPISLARIDIASRPPFDRGELVRLSPKPR